MSVPDTALDSGYAESKWVSERILQRFASETSLSATSVRCGQMTGGRTGTWNEHEWFPSIVKSSVAFGMFPLAEGVSRVFARFVCVCFFTLPLHFGRISHG